MRGENAALVDGSYFYTHLESPLNQAVRETVQQRSRFLSVSSGFVEDEVIMYRNTAENLRRYSWRVIPEALDRPNPGDVAVIVGSGPSFDGAVSTLKQVRDRVTVFSAGSALRGLLANGISPDFHCELENDDAAPTLLTETAKDLDLSGVRLVGADAIDPRVGAFFEQHYLFFRPATTGSRVFAGGHLPLSLSSPTVANVAARSAFAFGFRTLILIGVDLGSKTPERHHAEESFYNVSDDPYWRSGTNMEALTTAVPGNFGGSVFTNGNLQFAQMFFEKLFAVMPPVTIYNASDGALISGTQPLPLSGIAEKVGSQRYFDPDRDLADLPRRGGPGEDQSLNIVAYRSALEEWFNGLEAALTTARSQSFDALHTTLKPYLQTPETAIDTSITAAAQFCASGSLSRCLMVGHYMVRRMDAHDVRPFMEKFHDLLCETVTQMREKAFAQFDVA